MLTETDRPKAATRSAVDAVYKALERDSFKPLAKVVQDSGLEREVVRGVLRCAQAGGVVAGADGKWSLGDARRTEFRDGTVLGTVLVADKAVSLQAMADTAHCTWSQAYTSVARLRAQGRLTQTRDGTRHVRYTVS
jgi:hypothetical protein